MEHSKRLSPSASGLWMICAAMPELKEKLNLPETTSPQADRGTLQHHYAETRMRDNTPEVCPTDLDPEEWADVLTSSKAILDALEKDGSGKTKNFKDFYEIFLQSSDSWRADCFGTCDFLRVDFGNRTLYVFDHKFGRVAVPAKLNSQLLIYVRNAFDTFAKKGVNLRDKIDRIVIGISQPKVSKKADVFEMSTEELFAWDEDVLKPAQARVVNGSMAYVPGPHCKEKYCKVISHCPKVSAETNKIMDDFMKDYEGPTDFKGKTVAGMTPEELSSFLRYSVMIEGVIAAAKERGKGILDAGEELPGFKLVEGKGMRAWKDEEAADKYLANQKIKVIDRYEKTLLSAPKAEKLLKTLGKLDNDANVGKFNEQINYVPGSATMAPENDPRPAIIKETESCSAEEALLEIVGDDDDLLSLLNGQDDAYVDDAIDIDDFLSTLN